MNFYQLDKQSTKFTIWKYWKGCVKKLDGNISDLRCGTHRYSSNRYGNIVPIVVSDLQLFVYNIVRVISVAMLFFITGCISTLNS